MTLFNFPPCASHAHVMLTDRDGLVEVKEKQGPTCGGVILQLPVTSI